MNPWKVILPTLAIFVAGVVTGALLVVYSGRSFVTRPGRSVVNKGSSQVSTPGTMRLDFLRRVQRDLELTQEQHEKIDRILKESQERMRKIEEPVTPAIREEMRRTREELRDVLTPEQRLRFDEIFKHPPHLREKRPSANGRSAVTNAMGTNLFPQPTLQTNSP